MATLEDGDSEGENPNGGGGACDKQRGNQARDRDRESSQSGLSQAESGNVILEGGEGEPVGSGEDEARASRDLSDSGKQVVISNEKQVVISSGKLGASGDLPNSESVGGTGSPWLKKSQTGTLEPVIEVVGGVASMQIPEDIFDESELLWKSFVVGYFIGDAPHIGPVHATQARGKVMRTKDLLYLGKQGSTKKASVRKI
ncbi:hypothetical protein IGI04_002998 [Brassica rapa subsp. trilocularis]|uniref:Uncharacterized protein n=1 Tax=Brassica rapa subsp. trilocularis TaxID=1813537 RepID=A0ABQ7NZ51_BRACM|nr:hypothetical protein IGI04_002998 [Brassica rapa subsp. trilocularis]